MVLIQLQNGLIAFGSEDGTIKIVNPKNGYQCIQTLTGHTNSVQCLI